MTADRHPTATDRHRQPGTQRARLFVNRRRRRRHRQKAKRMCVGEDDGDAPKSLVSAKESNLMAAIAFKSGPIAVIGVMVAGAMATATVPVALLSLFSVVSAWLARLNTGTIMFIDSMGEKFGCVLAHGKGAGCGKG